MRKATAPILAHYGANDARVNAGIANLEANLTGTFVEHLHEGAGHGFNNDTGGGTSFVRNPVGALRSHHMTRIRRFAMASDASKPGGRLVPYEFARQGSGWTAG
jgi:dienelactone hydrolase